MATEQQLLLSLGLTNAQATAIMNGTSRLLLLDASAHLDWDWLCPFPVLTKYVSNPVSTSRAEWYFSQSGVGCANDIFTSATKLFTDAQYRYSICETGFLRGFAQVNPTGFQALLAAGVPNQRLRSEGGGITSPDNLLTHGETFIRNYLLGHQWLSENAPGIVPGQTLWIPDDFGHDPELPVVAQAMGIIAAGFERIPGANTGGIKTPLSGQSLAEIVGADKIDFNWTASDGSSMTGHWLPNGYGQGNNITGPSDIAACLDINLPISPTPYIHVPVLSDFSMPNVFLSNAVKSWNSNPPSPYQNVIAVCGSFEIYAQLLQFHISEMDAPYGAQFNANPFWTGCIASHTAVKIYHQRATRKLLAAEAFSLIAQVAQPGGGSAAMGTGNNYADEIQEAWEILVPSTHHDFIPGTAIPDVFHNEQMSLLRQADERADWILDDTLRTIAGSIIPSQYEGSPVVVFNALGFSRSGIAELTAKQLADGDTQIPASGAQASADGGLLFSATVSSLGYQTVYLGKNDLPDNVATVTSKPGSAVLANGLVQATLTPDDNGIWGLTSVIDLATNKELVRAGAVMNDLLFYADGGDEYMLGMEFTDSCWQLTDVSANLSDPTIEILEKGPLRATVRTSMVYTDSQFSITYVRDYILYANEPMLRMRSTGSAPLLPDVAGSNGATVVVSFPLQNGTIDTLVRGTPYHWTDLMPPLYWNDQTFMPTHNFAIPVANGNALCAIYHSDIPGWGLSNQALGKSTNSDSGSLYGMLWRNGNAHYYNWVSPPANVPNGSDPDVHVREYALRMPSTLESPLTGAPLQEALAFASPLMAVPLIPWNTLLPDGLSLASSSQNGALIMVAKTGTVNPSNTILRVYQPSNASLATAVTLNAKVFGSTITAIGQTALEQELSTAAQDALNIQVSGNTVYFDAGTLTTLAINS